MRPQFEAIGAYHHGLTRWNASEPTTIAISVQTTATIVLALLLRRVAPRRVYPAAAARGSRTAVPKRRYIAAAAMPKITCSISMPRPRTSLNHENACTIT